MGKYDNLIAVILKNIGGKKNILGVTHCMTRLRFTLKDNDLVNNEELLKSPDVMTAQFSAGRYQVVIGTQVAEVFKELQKEIGLSEEVEKEEKKGLNGLIEIITKVITPILGILTASGLLQGILAILTATKLLDTGDGAYIILHAMGQAAFYFLPVTLGYTSAKAFKLNPFVGMMLGATLIIPELMTNLVSTKAMYVLFNGSIFQTPVYNTFLGIPILFPMGGYQNTVIPIIFMTYFASKIESWLKEVIPDILAHNLNAFLTILVTVPLSILIIGPITNVLSSIISASVSGLYSISPIITSVFVSLLYQPLVIFGLHWPISAIGINNLAQSGVDYIFPMTFTANFAQTAVVLAVFLKTKSKDKKSLAVPAMISGLFCIIEPAIYGFSLPVKKRFAFSMIGGTVGSFIISIFSAKMYAMSFGVLGFASFINPKTGSINGLIIVLIATAATIVVSFLLTYFTFNEENETTEVEKDTLIHTEKIVSPSDGVVKGLNQSSDVTFSSNSLGKGIVLIPKNGKINSPVSGRISAVFPGGHAIGITSDLGIEILIHIGIDTVNLKGKGFTLKVEKDQMISSGDRLVEVDLNMLEDMKYSNEIAIIITNSDQYLDIIPEKAKGVKSGDKIITVIPFAQEYVEANNGMMEV